MKGYCSVQEIAKRWGMKIGTMLMTKIIERARKMNLLNIELEVAADNKAAIALYPAFHMNKKCWVSIILEDALSDEEIQNRIRFSFETA